MKSAGTRSNACGEPHFTGLRAYESIAAGFGDAAMAVVGGTGASAAARGQGTAPRSDAPVVGYAFTFTVTTD